MAQRNYSATAGASSLSAAINSTTTTVGVATVSGLPAAPFTVVVDPGEGSQEVLLVTSISGTTLTVSRGFDSTPAVSHAAGAVVLHAHTATDFREANTHVNASTGVHGLAAGVALVGASTTQTLTGKSISLGTNTVTGTMAQFNAAVTDGDFASTTSLTTTETALTTLAGRITAAENVNTSQGGTLSSLGGTVSSHTTSLSALSGLIGTVSATFTPSSLWTFTGLSVLRLGQFYLIGGTLARANPGNAAANGLVGTFSGLGTLLDGQPLPVSTAGLGPFRIFEDGQVLVGATAIAASSVFPVAWLVKVA